MRSTKFINFKLVLENFFNEPEPESSGGDVARAASAKLNMLSEAAAGDCLHGSICRTIPRERFTSAKAYLGAAEFVIIEYHSKFHDGTVQQHQARQGQKCRET